MVRWIRDGGSAYVCGDAGHMAKVGRRRLDTPVHPHARRWLLERQSARPYTLLSSGLCQLCEIPSEGVKEVKLLSQLEWLVSLLLAVSAWVAFAKHPTARNLRVAIIESLGL
jgi:hypothetical protein